MKAIVRTSLEPGCMEVMDRPVPEIAGDEVLIKVKAVGVCGTDLHIYSGNVVTGTDVIIGHELAGVIEKAGPEVTRMLWPISAAMMPASVVLPSPGGPYSSKWSSGSGRSIAACM